MFSNNFREFKQFQSLSVFEVSAYPLNKNFSDFECYLKTCDQNSDTIVICEPRLKKKNELKRSFPASTYFFKVINWKHQSIVWNLSKVNNKDTIKKCVSKEWRSLEGVSTSIQQWEVKSDSYLPKIWFFICCNEGAVKRVKNAFYFMLKLFSFLRYLSFCPDFHSHVGKRLDKKAKVKTTRQWNLVSY